MIEYTYQNTLALLTPEARGEREIKRLIDEAQSNLLLASQTAKKIGYGNQFQGAVEEAAQAVLAVRKML